MFLSHALRMIFVSLKGPIKDTVAITQRMMATYLDGMVLVMQSSITTMHKKMQNANALKRLGVMPYSEILWIIAIVAVTKGKMQV